MGNKIKIDEIKSENLRRIANEANTVRTKKGNLTGKEIVLFQQKVKEQNLVQEAANESDAIKNILGFTPSSKVEEVVTQSPVVRTETSSEERTLEGTYTAEEVAAAEAEAEAAAAEKPATAETVAKAAVAEKDAADETAAKKDEAEAAQPQKIDRTIKIPTRVFAGSKEYHQLLMEYTEARKQGKGPKTAYKEVEAKHKADLKNKSTKKAYKNAMKELKDYAKNVDAQLNALNAVHQSKATESKKQVKKDAEAILTKDGKIDSWDKRAINGNKRNILNWLSGQDSAMKEERAAQLYGNRAAKIKEDGVSMEDIVKRLGKDCPYLQKVKVKDGDNIKEVTILEAADLIKVRPDGKYDISALSDLVGKCGTGSDNTQSRQKNKPVREKFLNIGDLNAKIYSNTKNSGKLVDYPNGINLSNINMNKYSKRIVRLTGRKVERKNIIKEGYENSLGGAIAGAAGASVAAFRKIHVLQHILTQVKVTSTISGEYSALLAEAGLSELSEKLSAGIEVNAEELQEITFGLSHYAKKILKGAGIGAAIGLLSSALSYGRSEKEVIPNITDCKTFDEFVVYMDSLVTSKAVKPVYGEIAELIAYSFTNDDGTMDCCAMNEFLGYKAGNGSRLNRAELMAALKNREAQFKKPEPKPTQSVVVQDECENCDIEKEEGVTININTVKFRAWDDIANGYDCFEKYKNTKFKSGATLANRMAKVIQAIDVEKVTEENVKSVFNVDTIAEFTKEAATNGIDSAIAKFPNMPVDKAKYKAVLSAKGGVNGTVIVPTLYDSEGNTCEWSAKTPVAIKKGGRGTASGTNGRNIKGNDKYTQVCKDENGNVISRQPSNKDAYDKKHSKK